MNRKHAFGHKLICCITLLTISWQISAETSFIRAQRNSDKVITALETAVISYKKINKAGKTIRVDLISAVHVADKEYYEQLNELFTTYDAVLYELVAPEGTDASAIDMKDTSHPVSKIQVGMKNILNLSFQLDHIDYSKKNLVHADLSPDAIADSMSNKGESFIGMFFKLMLQSMAMQNSKGAGSDLQYLVAMLSENRALKLKRLLAVQFEDLEEVMPDLEGEQGSTIIAERNKKALEVLRQQLNQSKRSIAIFYGAGHMPDFDARLISEFGLKPEETHWLTAWKLSD